METDKRCNNTQCEYDIIGRNEVIDLLDIVDGVPAKIDTGADGSAIWASNVRITPEGKLEYCLFDEGSEWYTGEVFSTQEYRVAGVMSSNGERQVRFNTIIPTRIGGKIVRIRYNLSDRSRTTYPILIGRRSIAKKFLVDVSKEAKGASMTKASPTKQLNKELKQDPYAFYRRYCGEK